MSRDDPGPISTRPPIDLEPGGTLGQHDDQFIGKGGEDVGEDVLHGEAQDRPLGSIFV